MTSMYYLSTILTYSNDVNIVRTVLIVDRMVAISKGALEPSVHYAENGSYLTITPQV